MEEQELRNGTVVLTGRKVERLNLVLDCLSPHDFCPHSHNYVNLQQYVIKEKKLTEQESLWIFREIVTVVSSLHQVCPVVQMSRKIFYFILFTEKHSAQRFKTW